MGEATTSSGSRPRTSFPPSHLFGSGLLETRSRLQRRDRVRFARTSVRRFTRRWLKERGGQYRPPLRPVNVESARERRDLFRRQNDPAASIPGGGIVDRDPRPRFVRQAVPPFTARISPAFGTADVTPPMLRLNPSHAATTVRPPCTPTTAALRDRAAPDQAGRAAVSQPGTTDPNAAPSPIRWTARRTRGARPWNIAS
jgi:hypothetical protein